MTGRPPGHSSRHPRHDEEQTRSRPINPHSTRRVDWTNTLFLIAAHALAVVAVVHLATVRFSWWTVGAALAWLVLTSLSVTAGYHRLFAHRSYQASRVLQAVYLLFGAAAVQNSAVKWAADHRRHHASTDREDDPYNIRRGFWWAHVGWVLQKSPPAAADAVPDLTGNPLVRFQHRHYVAIAVVMSGLVPAALGLLWGDLVGAILVVGFLRIVLLWHATFSINSFAHMVGKQPYSTATSARDSLFTALISFGEGYHNFHHRFQNDFRNGVRWFHFDPTKWFIWSLSRLGLTRDLRRAPAAAIRAARDAVARGMATAARG
jgi:stearoyl-CoA desaturase (delta-9 desaturase)